MDRFRVALSGDFRNPDGSLAYPDFDLSPLQEDPDIELAFVPADGAIRADDLAGFDALILLAARFERASVPADGRLALVARFGVGYHTVDVDACSDGAIALVITPDGVRRPVAVSILTLIFALAGRLMDKDRITRAGPAGWAAKSQFMGMGLVGRTLGSVGIGNIGAEMFRLARPFDLRFIAHDPYAEPKAASALGVELVPLDEVFQRADFVTINCPLNDSTRGLADARRLSLMKPTAFLVNTARGPIVDQTALVEALADRRIAGAGLDVFAVEPVPAEDPILALDNVILAPHALCWTDQLFAGNGAADTTAVLDLMHGYLPRGIVNRDIVDNPVWRAKLDRYRSTFGS